MASPVTATPLQGARGCIDLRLRRRGATSHNGAADDKRHVFSRAEP